jgi:hypothetical protein
MFTTPCFIRKNTPELINKLIDLGYVKALFDEEYTKSDAYGLIVDQGDIVPLEHGIQEMELIFTYNFVDCGDNEELFIALASMTDNEYGLCDYYIVTDDYKPQYEKGSIHRALPISSVIHPNCYRKATAEELIGHFKKE